MRKTVALLMVLAGCNFDGAIQCVADAAGASEARWSQVAFGEGFVDISRPDEASLEPDGGRPLYVSGAHAGGRLVARFNGPLVSGTLPRVLPDAGCEQTGDYAFFYVPDGGTSEVSSKLVVSTGDAGETLLDFTQLTLLPVPDGGTPTTLPDRTIAVPTL